MNEEFDSIKKEYSEYYNSFFREGNLPLRDTGNGFWGPAVSDEIFEAFKKIKLHECSSFLDLGSGDGKVVLIASLFCRNALGIERDKELILHSMRMKDKLKRNNAVFIDKDFFEHDLSKHDVVFIYPDRPISGNLEGKLLRELKGKLVVYGHHFHPKQLRRENNFTINGTYVGIYSNQRL